jgi:NAD(P)-dependent dehydrogenase (short-subunit alcohol dehydrogenase family)
MKIALAGRELRRPRGVFELQSVSSRGGSAGAYLDGVWYCSRAALPHMLKKGKGDIVNIASVHAFKIIPHCFPYPIAKHAVTGLTRALAIEYADRNIRVNAIAPGYIGTEIGGRAKTAINASKPLAIIGRTRAAVLLKSRREVIRTGEADFPADGLNR